MIVMQITKKEKDNIVTVVSKIIKLKVNSDLYIKNIQKQNL